MLTRRIIPCLDIKDGRTVKGIQFENIKDMGDPAELAAFYAGEGADELVLLDITATFEKRKTLAALVHEVARRINIPFTVGGGVSSVEDINTLLRCGADKVSLNTAAFKQPSLIRQSAERFGKQCIVVAVDSRQEDNDWFVYLNGGRVATGVRTLDWIKQAEQYGAGEILLTAINSDGTQSGFAVAHTRNIAESVRIPVIASGGAGNEIHFADILTEGKADAALAAGIFHSHKLRIQALKTYLSENNIPVRL